MSKRKDVTGEKFGRLTASCGCLLKEKYKENFIDISGKIFGKWMVTSEYKRENGLTYWKCICSCENKTISWVLGSGLRQGKSKSCGCGIVDSNKNRSIHNLSKTRIYRIYQSMLQRCYNDKNPVYKHYGQRGIIVCDEWLGETGFENFYMWAINNGYSDNLTIDRIDVNGNYTLENCRWITHAEQQNNRRNNLYVEIDGVIKTAQQWEREYNLTRGTISRRLKRGVSGKELLKPVKIKMAKNNLAL